jgi:hypothetical protein
MKISNVFLLAAAFLSVSGFSICSVAAGPSATMSTAEDKVVVKSVAEYNMEHKNRAFQTAMLLERQQGNTCVYYQARSALKALGLKPINSTAYVQAVGKLEDVNFAPALEVAGITASHYLGGFVGTANSLLSGELPFDGPEDAYALLEKAVDAGRVVLVALDSTAIHQELAKQRGLKLLSKGGSHAVRVLGLHRNEEKKVDSVYLYDTAAPGKTADDLRYEIPYHVFKASYQSGNPVSTFNRGVYVSAKSAFPEIVIKF